MEGRTQAGLFVQEIETVRRTNVCTLKRAES